MQKLQLSIPEPCHENWQQMTPTEQGRFCNACAKEVVDLSMMTDTEVLNYFTTLTHEKICGRALPTQLDRAISRPKEPKKRLFWYWNYIVLFFMVFSKSNHVKAQTKGEVVTIPIKAKDSTEIIAGYVGVKRVAVKNIISGKIMDENANPLAFASIRIKNSKTGVSADAEGKYSIKVNPKSDTLEITSTGYDRKIIELTGLSTYDFVLSRASAFELGSIVVISHYGTKRKMSTGGIVVISDSAVKVNPLKSVMNKVSNFIKQDSLKIYPNPVQHGNTINVSLKLKQTGNHNIQITDATGRIVLQKQTNIQAKEYIEQVQTDSRWASGVYYLNIFDNNNKPISKSSFIVK
ncbi:MAG: carboxypeptidase-like regulatory domain-containing protein [Ferruginibacter sp.]